MVHELVKRGLEGDRLMELLSGWKKVTPPFLVPWPQIFSDLRAAVVWDSDGEGERGKEDKECGNKLL